MTGAIAPARQNGVIIVICPARAKSIIPRAIGISSIRGELELITAETHTPFAKSSSDKPIAV